MMLQSFKCKLSTKMFQRCYWRQLGIQCKSFTQYHPIHLQRTSRTLHMKYGIGRNTLRCSCRNIAHNLENHDKAYDDKYHESYGIQVCISNFRDQKYGNTNRENNVSNIGRLSGVIGGMLLVILLQLRCSLKADEAQCENQGTSVLEPDKENSGTAGERNQEDSISLEEAILKCRAVIQGLKTMCRAPGISVAVTIDGKTVWAEGFGYADIENCVPCRPETVLRIASISKSITMAAVAKLWEKGDLDLDKPVQYYVPEFPEKTWKGRKVTITTRQLIYHIAGIRHYDKRYQQNPTEILKRFLDAGHSIEPCNTQTKRTVTQRWMTLYPEVFNVENYESVIHGLDLFKDDPLVKEPGRDFYYSSFGWNLVGAVVERAAKMPFHKYLQSILDELGMENTHLEQNDQLIKHRGRQYVSKDIKLLNAPYIDVSYKWASEGILSNVLDLAKFGNLMLYSYGTSSCHGNHCPAFLKSETVKRMWSLDNPTFIERGVISGMGWRICLDENEEKLIAVSHTGSAVGGQSILFILPSHTERFTLDTSSQAERQSLSVDQTVQKELYTSDIKQTSQAVSGTDHSTESSQQTVGYMPDLSTEHSTSDSGQAVCDCTVSSEMEISKQECKPKGVVVSILINSLSETGINPERLAFSIAQTFRMVKN